MIFHYEIDIFHNFTIFPNVTFVPDTVPNAVKILENLVKIRGILSR